MIAGKGIKIKTKRNFNNIFLRVVKLWETAGKVLEIITMY